jgi:hypothetical protein
MHHDHELFPIHCREAYVKTAQQKKATTSTLKATPLLRELRKGAVPMVLR